MEPDSWTWPDAYESSGKVRAICPVCKSERGVDIVSYESPRFDHETKEWLSVVVTCQCRNCCGSFAVAYVPKEV